MSFIHMFYFKGHRCREGRGWPYPGKRLGSTAAESRAGNSLHRWLAVIRCD